MVLFGSKVQAIVTVIPGQTLYIAGAGVVKKLNPDNLITVINQG